MRIMTNSFVHDLPCDNIRDAIHAAADNGTISSAYRIATTRLLASGAAHCMSILRQQQKVGRGDSAHGPELLSCSCTDN